ncbi:MAG: T9SS type A sorting domain-containing protein [Bacteroidales bacterium]|nr:T9SS type A sorting domain-containing protein [Bacteroidales bacterium]
MSNKKIYVKLILLTLIFFVLVVYGNAQNKNWCATVLMDQEAIKNDPAILQRRTELEKFTENYINNKVKTEEILIIPVVFHIVHDYGDENISKEKIEYAIEIINDDFRKRNREVNGIVYEFVDIIADVEVEFRLAKIDPDGNCTEGINRVHSLETYNATNNVKYAVPGWNPSMYLNIWVVNSIGFGAAAWSHYPGITPALDGVVSIYHYVGSGHTLSHEIGHYLNLMHPWGNTNEPAVASNCYIDDYVDDTPTTIGCVVGSCNRAQESCGSLDNVENFMDYCSCGGMFTEGQKQRMRAALNSTISSRNNLWKQENLIATGTHDDYISDICSPIVDFISDENYGCEGFFVQFTDLSYNAEPDEWLWQFPGGEPETSTEQNPVINYIVPGVYNVSLTASTSTGYNEITKNNIISVKDTILGQLAPYFENMENADFPDFINEEEKRWEINGDGSRTWQLFEGNGNNSLRVVNYYNSNGDISTLISPNINVSEIEKPTKFTYKLAYARRNGSSNDVLKVYTSIDCGSRWQLKDIMMGYQLVTNNGDYLVGEFIPDADEWKEKTVSLSSLPDISHIMLKFECKSNGGNCLYIDEILIGDTITSINKVFSNEYNIKIFPNPFNNDAYISYNLSKSENIEIILTNILGNRLGRFEKFQNKGNFKLNISDIFPAMSEGIYFIKINFANKSKTLKIIHLN